MTVLRGGVAWCRDDVSVTGDRNSMSDDPWMIASYGVEVLARIFSGGGIELVSNNGILDEGFISETASVDDAEDVNDLVGAMSIDLVMDFVIVMNLVLFSLSSILNVYGERMVATSKYSFVNSFG